MSDPVRVDVPDVLLALAAGTMGIMWFERAKGGGLKEPASNLNKAHKNDLIH